MYRHVKLRQLVLLVLRRLKKCKRYQQGYDSPTTPKVLTLLKDLYTKLPMNYIIVQINSHFTKKKTVGIFSLIPSTSVTPFQHQNALAKY